MRAVIPGSRYTRKVSKTTTKKQSCFTHINSFTAPYFWRETSRNNQKLKAKHCKRNLSPTILTGNRQGKLFPNFASHRLITHSCYHSDTFTVGICFNMWKRHAIFPINLPQGGIPPAPPLFWNNKVSVFGIQTIFSDVQFIRVAWRWLSWHCSNTVLKLRIKERPNTWAGHLIICCLVRCVWGVWGVCWR